MFFSVTFLPPFSSKLIAAFVEYLRGTGVTMENYQKIEKIGEGSLPYTMTKIQR